ncbi:MAG: beta-propeller fold lactonase family protein [Acidobacteriota bacterium]|nr:beta-propeller fold lactonase family protein [Acidobacteriota bacterium]
MKWNRFGRGSLASILSVALLSVTACSRDYVLAYLYVTTAKPLTSGSNTGGVSAYSVDYQIGSLNSLADSPVPAGRTPITLIATPNGLNLYVINQDDSSVGEYSIGTDGKIYLQNTYNVTGSRPTAVSMDVTGTFLYVTFTYQLGANGQQLYSPASPGPGGVTIFPINKDGSLGSPSTVKVGNNPAGIAVTHPVTAASGNRTYVYVIDQEGVTNAFVLGFLQDPTSGLLSPVPGTTITTDSTGKTVATGYRAGVTPSAIAVDPSTRFVYITDQTTNQLFGSQVNNDGSLSAMLNSPFPTGNRPVGLTVDPRGKYLYVANYSSSTVGAYAIDPSTGTPAPSVGSSATNTDTSPQCVAIEPALGLYLYTANNLASDVSAFKLNPSTGVLGQVQNTPFPSSGLPTCAVAVANGSHPTQVIVQ